MIDITDETYLSLDVSRATALIQWMQDKKMREITIECLETRSPKACGMKKSGRAAIRQQMERLCRLGYFKSCGLSDIQDHLWVIVKATC